MNEKNLSRRALLRGAMTVGCSMFVPVGLLSIPAMAAEPAAPATGPKKVAQASVQYQSKPKGELKCATCANFIAQSNTCKVVDGQISPSGWCTMWVKKA